MSEKYTYLIGDFPNDKVDTYKLSVEITYSDITRALDYINSNPVECDIWFKAPLTSEDWTTLSGIVSEHDGESHEFEPPPTMSDGRPIVRADTRPLNTQTYFTMVGDTVSGIGDGTPMCWDFSNNDDIYNPDALENGPTIASGFKAKRIDLWFNEEIYLKDGTIYFLDATFGTNLSMYITVPAGNYYPHSNGSIPASALGLPGDGKYEYAVKDVLFASYVMRHHMLGDCPMGDELNAEGAQVEGIPIGWYITGLIITNEDNNSFKGCGSLEMYRPHTIVFADGTFGGGE